MRGKIALFQNHPECSIECCDGMIKALSPHYDIKLFGKEDFCKDTLVDVDIIAVPGGIGDADTYYNFFGRKAGNIVADFVEGGGKYLGICMGAYWAGKHYFDILDDLEPVQYIKRETTEIRRSYGTIAQVKWNRHKPDQSTEIMFFYDGCTFIGDGQYQLVSTYLNNEPMAIIQGNVGLIGCHPESEEFWYNKKHLKPYWHNKRHHRLLLGFVDQLMVNKPI